MIKIRTFIAGVGLFGLSAFGALPVMASDTPPADLPSVSKRAAMGVEAYHRMMDALDVPAEQRTAGDAAIATGQVGTLSEAIERAEAAQQEALRDEDRVEGYGRRR